ncbi:MAG TPA: carboxypeptidase regulatory-like domain-containing protein [Pyrinomonadaceae bacterium]|nr:carboxypeptidase regulatory-like domain-containing protein [Pyrinomonadaceae bacterium]
MRQGFAQLPCSAAFDRQTGGPGSLARRVALLAAIALLAVGLPRAAAAQQINASITGTVTTAREEVVPGASVVVESRELAVRRTAATDGEGFFVVPNLPVGVYRVTVEAEGFAAVVQENVKLDVGNTFSMTVRLNVAGVTETVQVSGNTYQTVNTETANVETLISGTQVTELALNGRNWAQLINLAPGTSALTTDSQQGTNVRIDDTAINGLRRRTAPTLDGASNVDHGSVGTQVNNISVDAIQEFKLVSSPYSAEYGAQAGPAVNVVTKRGTTEYHGSVFEFFRHDALNAYSWESKQRATPEKPLLRFNNFGGFIGGPAYKEKLFFFGGVEFKRPRTGRSLSELVPTEAMRRGDFSAFLPANVPANNTSCAPAGVTQTATRFILCDKSASTAGVAFPGNVIPASKLSPNGLAILKLFPRPNAGADRYIAAPVTVRNVRQDVLRVDYQATQNATFFVRWLNDRFDSDNPLGSSFDNQNLPIAPDNHVRKGKTLLGSYTQVLTPTLVNEASVAWQRNDQEISYQDEAQIARSTYGINFAELFPENRLNKIPQVSIQGYSQISGNGLPYVIDARNWELRDNLTKVWGGHTWKFGAQYINAFKSENTRVRDGGDITFSTGSTAGTSFRPQDAGHAVANLLLGAFTRYTETSNTTNAPTHYNQFEVYANDQWRAHKRLTLTLGLRAQYIPWAVADDGNIVGFDPARFDPAKAPLASNISGGVINLTADPTGTRTRAQGFFDPYNGLVLPRNAVVSDPNLQRLISDRPAGLATSGRTKLAPRLGFAWDPWGDGKTSIRGGAGVYYDRTLLNPLRDSGANAPFASVATVTNGRQFATPANLSGLSGFVNPLDTVGAGGTGRPLVQTLAVFDFDMQPGAVYAYSVGVQRQLWWDTVLDVSYVGNQGRHLTHRRDINYVLPGVALETAPGSVSATNPQGFTNRTADTVRQYLGYSAIRSQENTGRSNYNSLQMYLQKRVSRGFTASAAYTFSKALNDFDTETSDLRVPFDARLDRGHANFDRPHVFAASFVYELPWYRKQEGLAGHLLGGWQLSSIVNLQSGAFVNISGGSRANSSPSNGYGSNLDLVGDWRAVPGGQTPTPVFDAAGGYVSGGYINRAAFAPRQGLVGNVPRNLIQMPSTETVNFSVMKRVSVTEGVRIQLRGEVFNLFNHTNFRTLVTNFSASNFGALTETDEPRVIQFGVKLLF